MTRRANVPVLLAVLLTVGIGACSKKTPPVARPMPPPSATTNTPPPSPPPPPSPVAEPVPVPPEPLAEDTIGSKSLDDLNRDSPLKPLFFDLDSSEVSAEGQQLLQANAAVLKKYPTWQVTIEGHCDERGTAEYNLALGERRALSAKTYLVSLGIAADKVRIVSYGKEFPFDAGHDDAAWANNRRAHFVITAK
ncbi:MAG: peptidoglycan-associated lipoprotein [Acidobacteria bacterium RIFCSPLOWO2_12_FULL_67_14b]|nr:MAG: peptidoglycan-associated lipoprotein [Acidobacteria bacterium RIFCSPLOWO2_12_FULL_67_14b]